MGNRVQRQPVIAKQEGTFGAGRQTENPSIVFHRGPSGPGSVRQDPANVSAVTTVPSPQPKQPYFFNFFSILGLDTGFH